MEDFIEKELTREDLLRIVNEKTEVIRHFIQVSEEYKAKYEDAEKESNERRDNFNKMYDHYCDLEAKNKKLKDEIKALKKENEDLRTKLTYAKEEADGAIRVKNETDRLNANVFKSLKDEIEALKDALHDLECEKERLRNSQQIHIENLYFTNYENGPFWVDKDEEDE